MRGRERVCKKHIRQAGWSISNEGHRAQRQVNGNEPGLALWASPR